MSASEQVLLIERRGPVAHFRMNRPKQLNALDGAMVDALLAAFRSAAADESLRAILLSGEGRSFMAGGDLAVFAADFDRAGETAAGLIDRFHPLLRLIRDIDKPVVAALQGPVAGGGVSLGLACDYVLAADDMSLLSAYTKIATNPDGGASWTLTRLLGPRRALDFILSNERIKAPEALQLGLVNRVVPKDDLMPAAFAQAEAFAAMARGSVRMVKRLVGAALVNTFEAQLELEKAGFVENAGGADFREGVQAFFEGRPPRFS